MEFINTIEGMNFKPMTAYNGFLKGNAAFNIEKDFTTDFDEIFNEKKEIIQRNNSSVGSLMDDIEKSFSAGIHSVNDSKIAAEKAQLALATGQDISVHDVMIAAEKSSLSMQMAMQLRNKLLSAYTEIKNIQL